MAEALLFFINVLLEKNKLDKYPVCHLVIWFKRIHNHSSPFGEFLTGRFLCRQPWRSFSLDKIGVLCLAESVPAACLRSTALVELLAAFQQQSE